MSFIWPKEKTELLLRITKECLSNGKINWKKFRTYDGSSIFSDQTDSILSKRCSFLKRNTPDFKKKENIRLYYRKNTLKTIIKIIIGMDRKIDKNSKSFKVAVILYSVMIHGIQTVRDGFTGYPKELVREVLYRLLKNKVIGKKYHYYSEVDLEDITAFQIEFWLHVLVGEGLVKRDRL